MAVVIVAIFCCIAYDRGQQASVERSRFEWETRLKVSTLEAENRLVLLQETLSDRAPQLFIQPKAKPPTTAFYDSQGH